MDALHANPFPPPGTGKAPRAAARRAPLSFAQQRLWLVEQLDPGHPAYNLLLRLNLSGELRVEALAGALHELARRHEVLRTTFQDDGGTPVQVIAPETGLPLPVRNLRERADRDAAVQERVAMQARLPFDLRAGPLIRAELLTLGKREHVLLLAMHHIVSDGWSLGVIAREVEALYAAFVRGEPSPLPELPLQYADYAARQRESTDDPALERQLAYWGEHLADAPPLMELPTDRPRPPVQSFRGDRHESAAPPELMAALREVGLANGATLFMVVFAAFEVLLARYSGEEDLVLGLAVDNRTSQETEELVGIFVNTLVVRTDLSGNPAFTGLVQRVRDVALGAFTNWDVPFEKVVERLRPARSLDRNPVFGVMFAFQGFAPEPLKMPDLSVEVVEEQTRTAKFDLTLYVAAGESGLRFSFEYASDLFDRATIARMAGHFGALLKAIAVNPARPIGALPLLEDGERRRILAEWSRSGDPAGAGDFPSLFRAQAARAPGAVAVEHGGAVLVYGELYARAARLARGLRARGVGPEVRVAVRLERTPDLIVALLGVLEAGGAYVPLEPGHPAARAAAILADVGASLLLSDHPLEGVPCPVLAPREVAGGAAEEAAEPVRIHPESLSHVIYTSGSTGTPKGVMVPHGNVATRLAWMREHLPLLPGGRVLAATPVAFDVHVAEVHHALASGATLVLVGDALALADRPASPLAQASMVPAAARELLRLGVLPAGIARLNLAGEALEQDLARALYDAGVTEVNNLYGPTEDTTYSTYARVRPDGPVTIGRPLDGTRAYVLDPRLEPTPAGVPGELFLAGAGVTRGYLGRRALTATRYLPDPWVPGERMYATGDRVRWTARGELQYLGRLDAQLKIRGFRIEPGEVETALRSHPSVADAVVGLHRAGDEHVLAAWVVGKGAVPPSVPEMHRWLRHLLPDYMVPTAFTTLERLPLIPNGKLDRRALPAPPRGGGAAGHARTPVEETLAAIWAGVLRLKGVDRGDSFFEIGGHSLSAVRMLFLVRQAFGVELPLSAVFNHPTVAGLAAVVHAAKRAAPAPLIPAASRTGRGDTHPLSFAQQRLWVVHQMEPGSAAYHMPYALRLSGGLDTGTLGEALTSLVQRHEALCTVFPAEDGIPVQRVLPPAPVVPVVADLRHLEPDAREAEVARLTRDEAARPFDLAHGPLLRVRVLRVTEAEDVVLFTLHHIVSDGWSQEILVRDLSELYTALAEGREPVLPALPVQYADYARWQREWLSGSVLETYLEYWRAQLAGAPALLDLPTDRPRTAASGDEGRTRPFVLGVELSEALRAHSRAQGSTLFITLLAAIQTVLARWSGQADVVVGTPVAGRTQPETENVVGFFVNVLPVRSSLADDPPFRELVSRVRGTVLDAHAHQDLPFDTLVDALQPERSPAVTPLFQVLFSLQPPTRDVLRLGSLQAASADGAQAVAKYDLSLDLVEDGERISGGLLYRPSLFDASTAARMLTHLHRVLKQVAEDPELRLSRLALLDDAERRQVVEEWNRTEAEYPAGSCIHQLFEAQARRTPDAVAVFCGDASLSYAELDARANWLASHLVRRGVGPEARVGICLERGLDLIVCILGVLKAGAAYVPVDPGHPAERTGYVLRDSGVVALLTQERLEGAVPVPAGIPVLVLDRDWARIATEERDASRASVTPDNLCYVIYTSGSTGRPKGVAMHHRGVVNYLHWGLALYDVGGGSGAPLFSSIAVDLTVTSLLPLFAGRAVHVLPEENAVEALADALRRAPDFSLIKITPTHLSLLTPLLTPEQARAATRALVIGGDAVSGESTLWWQENAPEVRLINEYGPTETVVGCSGYILPHGAHGAGLVPVGGPIQNLRFYVLDVHMEPVPPGVRGELYVGGTGVARGYLGRPALSAEKFLPDPFRGRGARMYRTGDRARWLQGGNLLVLGRTDSQVKVRGYRVELGEIEAVLRRHPGVSACLVVLREDRPGDRRLVAYVVGDPDADTLRLYLRRSLPEYMVPAAFVRLPSLPNTSTGKIDPRSLPAPVYESTSGGYVAPRTPLEAELAAIWAQVLGVERVGVEDRFFEVGGDSILAIQAASRARWAGVDIAPRQMLEHHTVATLAAAAERNGQGGGRGGEEEAPAGVVPLTPIQAAFFSRGHPVPAHHNLSVLMEVDAAVPDTALNTAFQAVVRHHDALRLRFGPTSAGWRQWYAAEPGIELEQVDLSSMPASEREGAIASVADERHAALDLEHGPLGRGVVFDRGEDGRVLFLTLHHLVVDGVSWRIIREDLDRACAQAQCGERVDLGPRTTSFQRWAQALVEWAGSYELRAQSGYWLAQGPQEVPPLPVDGEGGRTFASERVVTVQLSDEETRALLHDVPGRHGTQINDVLLCALADAMERWTGKPRTRLAMEGHGRAEEAGAGLNLTRSLGWFTSIYPVVLDTTGASGVEERLRRVKEQLRQVPMHGVGYGVLRYLCPDAEVRCALAAQPEPAIIFNYLGQFDEGLVPGMRVRFAVGPRGEGVAAENVRPYPLSVAGSVIGGRLSFYWMYGEGTHRRETIERVAGWYMDALRELIGGPGAPGAQGGVETNGTPAYAVQASPARSLAPDAGATRADDHAPAPVR